MGHPQPPTRIRIDSKSAHGALTGIMKQKRAKPAGLAARLILEAATLRGTLAFATGRLGPFISPPKAKAPQLCRGAAEP